MTPLFVDLDECLVRSDTLYETFLRALSRQPLVFFRSAIWLLRYGRFGLKQRLAEIALPRVDFLPYNQQVIEYLRREAANGRTLVLATAAHVSIARPVAKHVGLFSDVIASEDGVNLKGAVKRDAILRYCAGRNWGQFGYIGDSEADLPIWLAAESVGIVGQRKGISEQLTRVGKSVTEFQRADKTWHSAVTALRLTHWTKNLLLIVPAVTSHTLGERGVAGSCAAGFVAFGLTASAIYLLNDLLDIESDRQHPKKCKRPLASGALSIPTAFFLCSGLLLSAGAMCIAWLPLSFSLTLLTYFGFSVAYSMRLKKIVLVDVIALAGLYTLRIVAGATLARVEISEWLAMFCAFWFVSLAMAKRHAEIRRVETAGGASIEGRGYQPCDASVVQQLGLSSGITASLVFALYINSDSVRSMYVHPKFLWVLCCGLFFWIGRVWLLSARGQLPEDPVVFALRDRTSYAVALVCLVFWILACL